MKTMVVLPHLSTALLFELLQPFFVVNWSELDKERPDSHHCRFLIWNLSVEQRDIKTASSHSDLCN